MEMATLFANHKGEFPFTFFTPFQDGFPDRNGNDHLISTQFAEWFFILNPLHEETVPRSD